MNCSKEKMNELGESLRLIGMSAKAWIVLQALVENRRMRKKKVMSLKGRFLLLVIVLMFWLGVPCIWCNSRRSEVRKTDTY